MNYQMHLNQPSEMHTHVMIELMCFLDVTCTHYLFLLAMSLNEIRVLIWPDL